MIVVAKHSTDQNKLLVQNDIIDIDTSGSYFGFYEPPGYHDYALRFYPDSIRIANHSGGLGGGRTCLIKGNK